MASLLMANLRLCGLLIVFHVIVGAEAFAWGIDRRARETPADVRTNVANLVHTPPASSRLSNVYALALNELQELESEPLCHRIAARLLVNNCQLVDGQDEATVHTDSGRAARDFVDSYAASLAICDLERGSFAIPSTCAKFRESTLATIPLPSKPQLHVSTPEIDACLEGLARSDSAWNTWVSYRHKTLRFCEAARADNEKDQNIHLYQRVTKILEKLTTEVEAELEARLHSLDKVVMETTKGLESLGPQVNHLRAGLDNLEAMISGQLSQSAKESAGTIRGGLDDAINLQHLLTILVKRVLNNNAEVAASHESSLQVATQQVGDEVGAIMATLATAVASTASLHQDIDLSHSRISEIARKQEKIESSMERLEGFAHNLTLEHANHQGSLQEAQSIASQLLNTLEFASSSASSIGASMTAGLGLSRWVPYIFCPAASLVMGSYGLPPSTARNILLISLGELAGFAISGTHQYLGVLFPAFTASTTSTNSADQLNSTFEAGLPKYLSSDFIKPEDLHRLKFIRR